MQKRNKKDQGCFSICYPVRNLLTIAARAASLADLLPSPFSKERYRLTQLEKRPFAKVLNRLFCFFNYKCTVLKPFFLIHYFIIPSLRRVREVFLTSLLYRNFVSPLTLKSSRGQFNLILNAPNTTPQLLEALRGWCD